MGVGQALGPRLPLLLQLLVARQHINLWRAKYLKSRMLSKSNKNSHFTLMSKFLRPLSSDHLRVDDLRIEVVPLSELLALRLEPLDGLPEGGQVAGHVIQLLGERRHRVLVLAEVRRGHQRGLLRQPLLGLVHLAVELGRRGRGKRIEATRIYFLSFFDNAFTIVFVLISSESYCLALYGVEEPQSPDEGGVLQLAQAAHQLPALLLNLAGQGIDQSAKNN